MLSEKKGNERKEIHKLKKTQSDDNSKIVRHYIYPICIHASVDFPFIFVLVNPNKPNSITRHTILIIENERELDYSWNSPTRIDMVGTTYSLEKTKLIIKSTNNHEYKDKHYHTHSQTKRKNEIRRQRRGKNQNNNIKKRKKVEQI